MHQVNGGPLLAYTLAGAADSDYLMIASLSTAIAYLPQQHYHLLAALKLDALAVHTVPLVSGSWETLQMQARGIEPQRLLGHATMENSTLQHQHSIAQVNMPDMRSLGTVKAPLASSSRSAMDEKSESAYCPPHFQRRAPSGLRSWRM